MVAGDGANSNLPSRTRSGQVLGDKVEVPLLSLRLDECNLRGGALDVLGNLSMPACGEGSMSDGQSTLLAHSIRTSAVRHLSLRGNKMGPASAVALALMIRDYPDSVPLTSSPPPSLSSFSNASSGLNSPSQLSFDVSSRTGTPSSTSIRSSLSALGTMATAAYGRTSGASSPATLPSPPATPPPRSLSLSIPANLPMDRSTPLPPPPRHPGVFNAKPVASQPQAVVATTYTPYIPRSKRNAMIANSAAVSSHLVTASAPTSPPIFQSSRAGGVTARVTPPLMSASLSGAARPGNAGGRLGLDVRLASASGLAGATSQQQKPGALDSHSAALLDNIRSLNNLPRLGSLTTLDLRGNGLRVSIFWLQQLQLNQVTHCNRTERRTIYRPGPEAESDFESTKLG